MFNLFKKHLDPTTTDVVAAVAQFLVDDSGSDTPTPFKEHLDTSKLDFSLESLKHIDDYLEYIKNSISKLDENQFTKVILRVGGYCGEVIRKNAKKDFKWITYDFAITKNGKIKDFDKSAFSFYILFSEPNDFSFPMAKVGKYIENGTEDSLYFFATMMLSE